MFAETYSIWDDQILGDGEKRKECYSFSGRMGGRNLSQEFLAPCFPVFSQHPLCPHPGSHLWSVVAFMGEC